MDVPAVQEMLRHRRSELEQLYEDLQNQDNDSRELSSADQHPADDATNTLDRSVWLSTLESVETELADLDEAESRLARGEYGRCEVCGREIAEERLRALPLTRRCATHAR